MLRQLRNQLCASYTESISSELIHQQSWESIQRLHAQLVDNLDLRFRRECKHSHHSNEDQRRELQVMHSFLTLSWHAMCQWFLNDNQMERSILALERKRQNHSRFLDRTPEQIQSLQGPLHLFLDQATKLHKACLLHFQKVVYHCEQTKNLYEETAKKIQQASPKKSTSWFQGMAMAIAMIGMCVVFCSPTLLPNVPNTLCTHFSQLQAQLPAILKTIPIIHPPHLLHPLPAILTQLETQTTLPSILNLVIPSSNVVSLPQSEKSFFSRIFDRFLAAQEYVDALHDLPPTYRAMEEVGFKQWFPDPVSRESIKIKLDRVNDAERALGI